MAGVISEYARFFSAIGVLSLSYIALRALYTLWGAFKTYLLSPVIGLGVDVKSLGEWAGMSGVVIYANKKCTIDSFPNLCVIGIIVSISTCKDLQHWICFSIDSCLFSVFFIVSVVVIFIVMVIFR